ncbi:class I SAM-dependent methyltransferase [Aerococcaceae bacterium DSM 111021]|nr:class I SAM-dependent methyltransferase [Aerococcaceae bacterium DSM 111021]
MAKLATEAIRPFLDKNDSKTAADIGCGTGLIGLELLDDVESMLFVDASEKMLQQVEMKLTDKASNNASVLLIDIEKDIQLPYKVDTIVLSLVLHHIPNHPKLLSNLYDNLNDNGQLLIIEMEKQVKNGHGVDRAELATELTELGYKKVQSKIFYNDQKENHIHDTSRFILSARKI